ncbi:hypothetical protein ACD578_15830 [Microvirga sp. RSM25]|uniref:hypothetical protein n=1 Tax=Microvirga sp. RSM25 TaxID=3273802 RepID=UPI00384B5802
MMTEESGSLMRREGESYEKYLNILIKRLQELQNKSSPEGGDETARKKDFAAYEALKYAGDLVELTAGWAIDHQIGLAFEGLEFVPLALGEEKQDPDYIAARAEVDDHRHEIRGAASRSDLRFAPQVARQLALNLLAPNVGGFPYALQNMLIEGLRSLEYGETLPIFDREKNNRKVGYREQQLQLQAIRFVYYRMGRGKKKLKAIEEVTSAYGIERAAYLNWEKRLRAELGNLTVRHAMNYAKAWGISEDENLKLSYQGKEHYPQPTLWDQWCGDATLQKTGKLYQAIIRE